MSDGRGGGTGFALGAGAIAALVAGGIAVSVLGPGPDTGPSADAPAGAPTGTGPPAPDPADDGTGGPAVRPQGAGVAPPPGTGPVTAPRPAGNPDLEFIVRFDETDPALAAAVERHLATPGGALDALSRALSGHPAFRDLVVHDVTLGGEVVLRYARERPVRDTAALSRRILTRLRADPAVAYADPNARAGLDGPSEIRP
jgi:hypothetical protein